MSAYTLGGDRRYLAAGRPWCWPCPYCPWLTFGPSIHAISIHVRREHGDHLDHYRQIGRSWTLGVVRTDWPQDFPDDEPREAV